MSKDTIAVFTGKSVETILRDGGSCSWVLNRANAAKCKYLVCCRSTVEWVQGPEPDHSAFLIGTISDIVPSLEKSDRWLIKISQYAQVQFLNVWKGWRNPVHYSDMDTLGIDLNFVEFSDMPYRDTLAQEFAPASEAQLPGITALTIPEAKRGLAKTFGVVEEAIEITIRG